MCLLAAASLVAAPLSQLHGAEMRPAKHVSDAKWKSPGKKSRSDRSSDTAKASSSKNSQLKWRKPEAVAAKPVQKVERAIALEKIEESDDAQPIAAAKPARNPTTEAVMLAQAIEEELGDSFEPIPEPQLQIPDDVGPLLAQQPDDSREDEGPTLEGEIVRGPRFLDEDCPKPENLKRIGDITTNISPEQGDFPPECPISDELYQPRQWAMTTYTWKASGLCHKPLYFEQVALERYGHTAGPVLEPFIAGAHFFGTFPILPYEMGMNPPWECIYDLGYYRPGSCAPRLLYTPPISLRGAVVEAGVWTGMVFLIP